MNNCGILLSNTNLEKLNRYTDGLRITCTAQGYTDSTAITGMPYMYVIKLKDYKDVTAVISGLNDNTNTISQQRAQELTTKYKFLYNAAQSVGAIGWIKR